MRRILITLMICALPTMFVYSQPSFTETEKIVAFCKMWGFLKYHHPTVATGSLDWDREFITRIDSMRLLTAKQDINNFYSRWINSLGKIQTCKKCEESNAGALQFNLTNIWLTDTSLFSETVINQLQYIQQNRSSKSNYYVQQVKSVGNTTFENEKPYADSVFPTAYLRLLGLARYWNIINCFYPYKYVIGNSWDSVLTAMVPKFLYARDTMEYHLAMLQLTASLHDTHAGFISKYTNSYFGTKWAPFRFKIIDNKAVVCGFYNEALCKQDDIKAGDAFVSVGGSAIAEIIHEKAKYIGASNNAALLRNFAYAIFNGNTDTVRASFERNRIVQQKLLHRFFFKDFNYKEEDSNRAVDSILTGNIGYINLGLLQVNQVDKVMERNEKYRDNKDQEY